MPPGGSPVGLGLSLPQLTPLKPRNQSSDLTARRVSAPPITPQFTASVAPAPSPYLSESAQTISIHAARIGSDSLANKSPAPVSRHLAMDAALLAGSVSVLVGVGVGVAYYRRKRIGRFKDGKRRKKSVYRAKGDLEDGEASPASLVHHAKSYHGRSSASKNGLQSTPHIDTVLLDSHRSPSLSTPSSSMALWSMSSSAPMSASATLNPLITEDISSPQFAPPMSSTRVKHFRDDTYTLHPRLSTELELGDVEEREGLDLGGVAMIRLKMHEEYHAVDSYDDHGVLPLAGAVLTRGAEDCAQLGSSSSVTSLESFDEKVATLLSQSALSPSPVAPGFEAQPHTIDTPDCVSAVQGLTLPTSPTYPIGKAQDSTNSPPKLLELTLNSEIDLRTWLGLILDEPSTSTPAPTCVPLSEMAEVPELMAADSQETVTGTDESFDGQTSVKSLSQSFNGEFISGGNAVEGNVVSLKGSCPQGDTRSALFKHIITRASVIYDASAFLPTSSSVLPSGHQVPGNFLTVSRSSSSSSSVTSINTLQMPSFRSPCLALLTKEVLPPPSIIVSVPTDGSIVPRDSSWGSSDAVGQREAEQQRWYVGMEEAIGVAGATVKMMHDTLDESEYEAWEDAYERTCYVETSGGSVGVYADVEGFAGSGMLCSESSELDIGEAVASFPLPPNGLPLKQQVVVA